MQIKSCIGFVKPNSSQHFTFSTALSAAQDLPISLLESLLLQHALQKVTFELLNCPCVITYMATLIYPFPTCILALLKKKTNPKLNKLLTAWWCRVQRAQQPLCAQGIALSRPSVGQYTWKCVIHSFPSPSDALLCSSSRWWVALVISSYVTHLILWICEFNSCQCQQRLGGVCVFFFFFFLASWHYSSVSW